MAKAIATLPPLEQLRDEPALSPRTGEPKRQAVLLVALILCEAVVAATAFSYAWHWYRAAYPSTYPISAHLTNWIDPEPGKWVCLTLEFGYAGLAALTAAAAGVVGFQAWNGHRFARWGGVIALVFAGLLAALLNRYGLIAVGLVAAGWALLWLPSIGRYFRDWEVVRAQPQARYRRPERIIYGRLPRFR